MIRTPYCAELGSVAVRLPEWTWAACSPDCYCYRCYFYFYYFYSWYLYCYYCYY